MIQVQFGTKIKIIRIDNGPVFDLLKSYATKIIVHKKNLC